MTMVYGRPIIRPSLDEMHTKKERALRAQMEASKLADMARPPDPSRRVDVGLKGASCSVFGFHRCQGCGARGRGHTCRYCGEPL